MVRHIRVRRHLRRMPKKEEQIDVNEYMKKINNKTYLNNLENFDASVEEVFQRCPNEQCNHRNKFKINVNIPCKLRCEKCGSTIEMDYTK